MKRSTKNGVETVGIAIAAVLIWLVLSVASLALTVFVIVWVLRALGVL